MLQACSSPTSRNYDGGKSKTKPEEVIKPKKVHIAKYNYAPRSRVSKIMSDHGLLWSGLGEFAKEFTNDEALSLVKYFTKREKYETGGKFLPMERFLQRIMLNTKSEEAQFIMINKVPHFIMYAKNPSERIQLASINQGHGGNIQYIRNPTEKVQLAAINKSVGAFEAITNPTDKVRNHPKVLAYVEKNRVADLAYIKSLRTYRCDYYEEDAYGDRSRKTENVSAASESSAKSKLWKWNTSLIICRPL